MIVRRKLYSENSVNKSERSYSFTETLKGNPKIKQELLNSARYTKISPAVEEDFSNDIPESLKRYLTFLINSKQEKDGVMITNNGLQYKLYSYNSILEQFDKGSVPFGVQSSKSYRRIVLMAAYADDGGFVISYNLDDKYFVVTKESAKFSYITRGVNWLFGEKGPQEKFKTDDIYKAIEYAFNSFGAIRYYR